MKRKSFIAISCVMLLLAGCSQESNEKQSITGKVGLQDELKEIINSLDILNETDDTEQADMSESNNDNSDKGSSSNEHPEKDNSKQNASSQSTQNKSNGESNQQSSPQEQPKQEVSQSQTQEPSKPTEPVTPQPEPKPEPKPSVPVCDDTIPAGAYPISREDEITSQVEAEMIKNLNEGKPTFEQYSIEYGVTECGTEYFYIIKK